ncbi:MAG TPA: hypothetical protein VGG64_18160 [Pirellulales bacterium]|jgi:hypothetical protein
MADNVSKRPLTAISVMLTVIGTALLGMILGGLFGLTAGFVGPDLFRRLVLWHEIEPIGAAVVLGAFGGVLCGGCLGGFAIVAQLIAGFLPHRSSDKPQ